MTIFQNLKDQIQYLSTFFGNDFLMIDIQFQKGLAIEELQEIAKEKNIELNEEIRTLYQSSNGFKLEIHTYEQELLFDFQLEALSEFNLDKFKYFKTLLIQRIRQIYTERFSIYKELFLVQNTSKFDPYRDIKNQWKKKKSSYTLKIDYFRVVSTSDEKQELTLEELANPLIYDKYLHPESDSKCALFDKIPLQLNLTFEGKKSNEDIDFSVLNHIKDYYSQKTIPLLHLNCYDGNFQGLHQTHFEYLELYRPILTKKNMKYLETHCFPNVKKILIYEFNYNSLDFLNSFPNADEICIKEINNHIKGVVDLRSLKSLKKIVLEGEYNHDPQTYEEEGRLLLPESIEHVCLR